MRRVLVLRSEPGATVTVDRARELGLDAVSVPLFGIEPVEWVVANVTAFDGLLLTSANAVRHGGRQLQGLRPLPVYAVGEATAAAAREAGFTITTTGNAGVAALLNAIPPELRLLHLCGEHRAEPHDVRQEIATMIVYRASEIPDPGLGDCDGSVALIHSPRAARRLAGLIGDRAGIAIAAISGAAAEAVGTGWDIVETATEPNDDALLALAARLCHTPATK